MSKYPRILDFRKLKGRGPRCKVCNEFADRSCEVQYTCFRGDDGRVVLCAECFQRVKHEPKLLEGGTGGDR